jgi:2,4-dienoyl-CoA reductase-like NADH-dependent reductase (Old Yellow Enzyme family)
MLDPLAHCFEPAQIRGLTLRNRLIKAATTLGMSGGGVPTPEMMRVHERIGEGGIGMTTLAYCAAESDGRLHEDMFYMHEGIRPQLETLIGKVHATGAAVSGQLGHSGGFTKNREHQGKRPLGPSRGFNSLGAARGMFFSGALSQQQIAERVQVFARAASFMKSVGFDAIEIHFGHGYGLSQFISPRTNKRTDEYGGSIENRMRFPVEVTEAVREAVGEDFPLLGKISMHDGVSGGVGWDDSLEIAAMLEKASLDVVICSAGTSSMNPMMLFHGDSMYEGMLENEKSPLMRLALKIAGPKLFRDYPYEEMYFLEKAKRIRDRVECGVCYIGGVATSESIATVMGAGFDFIQLGRSLIFDPDFPKRAQADPGHVNGCTHCNRCATLIEAPGGVHCVLRPDNFTIT